jgi:hypothetical protein
MMRHLIILVALVLTLPIGLFAQPGFNQYYDFDFPRNQFRNILVTRDTIIGYGIARIDSSPFQQCLFLARFDSSGSTIDNFLICDSLGGALSTDIPWSDMIETSDSGYGLTAFTLGRYDGMFIKLKKDLQVEFIKEYPDSVNLVEYYRKIIELEDGYLLCGHLQRPNYLQDAFIRKVDKQGNSIWFKYYGEYTKWDFFSNYIRLDDNKVIGVGAYQIPGIEPETYRPWVMVFDTNGVVLKQWKPAADVGFTVAHHLGVIDSGKWIIYAKRAAGLLPNGNVAAQSCLAIVDTSFQVEKVTDIGTASPKLGTMYDFEPATDGNFIAAGEIYHPGPAGNGNIKHGWMVKCNQEAEQVWSRIDLPILPDGDVSFDSYFGGVGTLSSGNIIAGGNTTVGAEIFCWLVKVTPDGCIDTIFCQSSGVVTTAPEKASIKIYPNPADGHFFVTFPESIGNLKVCISALGGQVIFTTKLDASGAISLPDFIPSGVYFLAAVAGNGTRFLQKLAIIR